MSGTRAALGAAAASGDVSAVAQANRALRAGQTAGGVAAAYPSSVGGILQAQREQSGETDLGSAAALGVPFAGLNALGIEGALARQQMLRSGISALDNLQGVRGGLARAGASGVRTGLTESGTETLQEMTTQVGRMAVDPNEAFLSDAALGRYKESAIGGAFLGGTAGGLTGFGRSEQYRPPQREINLLTPEQPPAGIETPAPLGASLTGTDAAALMGNPLGGANLTTPTLISEETDLTKPLGQSLTGTASSSLMGNPLAGANLLGAPAAPLTSTPRTELRDTYGVIATPPALQFYDEIKKLATDNNLELSSPAFQDVWNYASEKPMTPKRLEKVQQLLDAAIINARKEASSGTGVSTVQQPAGSVGVGGAVVPGTVGTAGSNAPIIGGVGGSTAPAGATSGQTSVLPSPPGQPPAPVAAQPAGLVAPVPPATPAQPTGLTTTAPAVTEPDILTQIFGEQDAGIVRDFLMGKSSAKIAAELKAAGVQGRGEQMIRNKIAGERAVREEWPKKIAAAKAKYGYTDAQIQQALRDSMAPDADTRSEVEREMNLGRADLYGVRMSETEAIEAGLEGSVKSAGGGSAAVKGFTKLQKSIDAMYKRLETEKDPMVLAYISNRLTELQKQVEAFEDREQARIRATAGLGDADGEVDLVAAAQEAEPDSRSISDADAAKEAEAAKFRAERAAKLAVDRKGLEVGDTVVNPKLGTGVVKGFSGDGDATIVTVDFQSGQTKELSVKMAKLEKTNAVQVQSTAVVPVQPEAQTGQGVGKQVRRAEKPTGQGQTQGQAKGQVDRGRALWESLTAKTPGLVPYEQLTKLEQEYLTDLAVRTNGKPVVAKEMGLQQLLTKEPVTIDVEARVIDEQVTQQVAALPAPQVDRLEKHYGAKRDTAEFLEKVQADITKYVTQGAEAVAGAIRSIIKAMAEGVLAMGIVFNPNITKDAFTINVGKTFQQTIEVTQEVPEAAKAKMSPTAQAVYSAMAPVAMKSGKWFMVADKPNGMLHIFKEDGSHALSDATLYGKDKGDVLGAVSSLEGGPKITPAGKFTMKESPADYAGGTSLILMESKDYTGYIAVHAADTSTPSENRLGRLASATAEDNRISYGCINTKHDTFINEIKPNISKLDGGMMFILPEAEDQAAKMFAAETRTETRTEGGEGAKGRTAATVVGKEENMLFGKDGKAKNPYTAKQLLAELKDFIRAEIPGRKLMVVNTIDDLLNDPDPKVREVGEAIQKENAYGVAVDGRAYLIADRVNQGSGRAKFMHEVGAHLGLENLLPKQTYDKLVQQLKTWAKKNDRSIESVLAQRATKRFESAGTIEAQQDNELLAYFLEEAIDAGIDPTAASKESGPLMDWFRTLWAAFKIAVRKLGLKPETLNAQDVVNLAFGAARLEINGTWHGTAAAFRKFNHDFMGTGEGAQAYGWGSYFAQSAGIAKGYWKQDVARKAGAGGMREFLLKRLAQQEQSLMELESDKFLYDRGTDAEMTPEKRTRAIKYVRAFIAQTKAQLAAMPEGSLMRVDIPIADEDVLDWDQPLSKQPAILAKIEASISDILREDLEDQVGADLADMTGDEFYRGLGFVEVRTGAVSEEFEVEDYNKRLSNAGFKEVVSKYLDEKIGIPALKFLDQNSRGDKYQTQIKLKQLQEVLQEKERAVEKATKEADKWEALQDKAPPEQKDYARKTWLNAVTARTSAEFQAEEVRQEVESLKQKIIRLDKPTRNVVVFNDKNIFRVSSATAANRQRMQFGKNAPTAGVIQQNIAKLPKASQSPVRNIVRALGDLTGSGLDYVVFTSDLIKRGVAAGLTSAQTFADALSQRSARVSEFEREIEKIADGYADIEDQFKGAGRGSVNDFLFESTRTLKWGYDSGKLKADPEMAIAFNKLGPKAQQFVRNVFAHGDKILSQKKQSVLKAANSEYDAMIQAAQNIVNTTTDAKEKQKAEGELAALKAEKVATLKRFQTLFAIREGKPYAPIKRDGAWVVIGKSAEYKAAETANDTAKKKKLESDPDHYHVSFVDTKWQARTLSDSLAEQGVFVNLDIAKRAEAFEEVFSGEALLPALTKIRSAVDKRQDSGSGRLLTVVNQLYLEALAEGSARKSEMRRRGVAGEVDMLQSFTRQGRADANFLASVEFEPLIQDALQSMRNEVRGGNRERKSEIFNELTKRYVDSLETKGNAFITGLTNTASKYFLASSPAYYMQNLTQPFMMSLPAMAGRHDYTKAGKALFDAYAELGPLFKNVKLFDQQFDFDKVPADVKAAIKELVNQGQIDIGLATEINEYKVDADNKLGKFAQRLNKSMRLAVQKAEAINRLSTAIAAYRLEFAKTKDAEKATQYAASILADTHGDYTAMNAPRIFNSQWGKIALQFRKFQLIQIAFYAKLMRDAFTNPAERAVAMRTLAFSLGHSAVFAGMMGLPGYAAVAAILGAFGDEDEPYDLTADMRQALGPEWADLVMRGAPTLVGVDLSGKIGSGNMLSIIPFSNADLSTTAGRAEAFGTLVGGASLGMASRVADGLGLILSGDYYKGIERTMPKGVSDALKAGRQAAEGMTRRNGDVVLPADEISAVSAILTGLGVPSVKETVVYERQNRMRDVTQNFQERTTRIKNDYVKAARDNDGAAKQEAREAWVKLQRVRQENGLKVQPLSDLLKAPQEQAKRERMTVGGVQYTKGTKKLAEEIAGD